MRPHLKQHEMSSASVTKSIADTLHDQLTADCQAMLRYALASGQEIPLDVIDAFARHSLSQTDRPEELSALALLHTYLVQLVAPATPLGI